MTASVPTCPSIAFPRPLWIIGVAALLLTLPQPAQGQPATDTQPPRAQLAQAVSDAVESDAFGGGFWGVQVINLRSGEVLHARNATRPFVPASNVKLATTAAALDHLGPDYRYTTTMYATGPVEDGTLHGNLIVRGAGDPTLGGYRQRRDPAQVFRQWADSLRQAGITRIDGNVIGDAGPVPDPPFGHGWSWEDLSYGYGAPIGGLIFNENTVDLTVRGRNVGQPARVQLTAFQTDYVSIQNRSRTVPTSAEDDEDYVRLPGTNTIRVRTRVYPSVVEDATIAISDPTRYFTHSLRTVLQRNGISVDGHAASLDAVGLTPQYRDSTYQRVASYTSPPLARIARTLNYESRNLYAEQLLRTLALEVSPETSEDHPPGSAPLGIEAVRETLVRAGVDTSRVELADGSGLSRQNLLTPRAVAKVLQHMWVHPDSATSTAFYESLPRGGEDGTLAYRFRGPGAPEVQAKTGTLSQVSALSGYTTTAQGTPVAFSILSNHHLAESSRARAAQDTIVNAIGRLPL